MSQNGQLIAVSFLFAVCANRLMNSPMEYIPDFTKALTQIAETIQPDDTGDRVLYIGLKGSFGDHHVNPRTLRAKHLGKLVCLEGIVTRCK